MFFSPRARGFELLLESAANGEWRKKVYKPTIGSNFMENYDKKQLDERQIAALKKGILLGGIIQKELPEIAEDYRRGMHLSDIVRVRELMSKYSIPSERVAINSVFYALKGYDGRFTTFGLEEFSGLMTTEELESLGKVHNIEHGRRMGKLTGKSNYEKELGIGSLTKEELSKFGSIGGKIGDEVNRRQGSGIYGLTKEQRSEAGKLGGPIGEKKSLERKVGVHAMTWEQRSEIGKRAGKIGGVASDKHNKERGVGFYAFTSEDRKRIGHQSAIARGLTPYSEAEEQTILNLSNSPQFIYQTGRYQGRTNCQMLAAEINKRFYNGDIVRNPKDIRKKVYLLKKNANTKD